MRRTEIGRGPAVDQRQPRVELAAQRRWVVTPVEHGDLLRAQAPGLRLHIVHPPGHADIQHVPGSLAVADREHRLAADPPGEAQLPGGFSPPVAFDQQALLTGEVFHGGGDGPKGVNDLRGNRGEPSWRCHRQIVGLRLWSRSRLTSPTASWSRPERLRWSASARIRAGYRIIPVNPNIDEVLGERAYSSLREVPERVDVVDVFRRSEFVGPIVDDAIAMRAHALWLQDGVIDKPAADRARAAGLDVVM